MPRFEAAPTAPAGKSWLYETQPWCSLRLRSNDPRSAIRRRSLPPGDPAGSQLKVYAWYDKRVGLQPPLPAWPISGLPMWPLVEGR